MTELRLTTNEPASLLLDLGSQPVSHKFLQQQDASEMVFPVRLGMGIVSGLVGLIQPPSWQALKPIYSWIKCNEPEDHLDHLADNIKQAVTASGSGNGLRILGLSQKDATLLKRLEDQGLGNIELFSHLDIEASHNPGVESVQAIISECNNCSLASTEKFDVIIARHILEHTTDTVAFLSHVTDLLTEEGCLVLEVPDNEKAFKAGHHTIVWEEHSLYFTQETLCGLLDGLGLSITQCLRYPMALEDILVVTVTRSKDLHSLEVSQHWQQNKALSSITQTQLVQLFADSFKATKQNIQTSLKAIKQEFGALSVLGAGHFGAAFINYYQLADIVDAVIDDDPNKQGLFMPGSRLPIQNSDKLRDGTYRCCLLTCNPWNNHKIIGRNEAFISLGGRFLSVFELEEWL